MQGGGLKQEGLQWDGISRMGSADATQQEEGWDKAGQDTAGQDEAEAGYLRVFPSPALAAAPAAVSKHIYSLMMDLRRADEQ